MQGVDFIPISVATLAADRGGGAGPVSAGVGLGTIWFCIAVPSFRSRWTTSNGLRGRGVHRLFISKESRSSYQKYLRKIATSNDPKSIPLAARAGALNEVVRDVLQVAFSKDSLDQTVNAAGQLGILAADIVTKDEFAASDLFQVLHHDYATFTHSANVAFYCGILAARTRSLAAKILNGSRPAVCCTISASSTSTKRFSASRDG